MTVFCEYRFWSPVLGIAAARLSTTGGQTAARHHGSQAGTQEYFAIIPADGTGKGYRDRRSLALDQIEDAIERGDPPGEVKCAD